MTGEWTRIVIRRRGGILVGEAYPLRKPRAMFESVLRADPCSYCGAPSETLDHIEPRSAGGRDLIDNLTGACARCNHAKDSQSLLGYLGGFSLSAPAAAKIGPPEVTRAMRQAERESLGPKPRKRTRWDGVR